ncbi:MAG TPA: MMPL family transporter [Solirubrobacterales bacterium]|nr:MMPL family transporter [Solirubrobacterales bacterium]
MIGRLAAAVTGPRGRLVTIAAWLLLGAAGLLAHGRIGDVTSPGESSFLPKDAESTRALDALGDSAGGSGEEVPAVIVFERAGGLTGADLDAIGHIGKGLGKLELAGATPIVDPFSAEARKPLGDVARIAHGVGPISRDGEAALVVLAIDADERGAIVNGVHKIRRYLAEHDRPGLAAYVTGPAGIAADLDRVADEAGQTLLIATLALVLVLLLVVYRAPVLAVLPLLTVGTAYLVAIGIAYLLIEAGWILVNVEGTFLLLVLIFGAGTDYSLLLVHRYREELDAGRPPPLALPAALRECAPALAASAGTVIAAMLVLLVADLQSTHWLGPILALGIAVMLAAALTLLPALLSLLDGRAFWRPFRTSGGQDSPEFGVAKADGRWERVAGLVRRRSGRIIVGVSALLAVLACGNLVHHGTIGFGQGETRETNSSRGTEALEAHFPAGLGAPLTAVVATERLEQTTAALEELRPVQLALPVPPTGDLDRAVILLVLDGDPYSSAAAGTVDDVRERLHRVDPGGLLGGLPAENFDIEQTNDRDTKLIVPLVLLVVGFILAAVLRALLAPLYLMVTVVASFAATLGLVTFAFAALGGEGIAFDLVLLAFIFLVALGVDYNIFLMTRAREEAAARGTREGVLVALVNTGGVVTGAGLILAGTFATLTLLPLEQLIQIGATVAIGVLLDTFVVRALLIPAITYRLGERAWWPSTRTRS